jgi:outer membrane protein assembly factor BamB/tetratricopeptide (TPR) repeat protein
VADGVCYCPTQYGRLFAVDLVTRRVLWNFEYPNTLTGQQQFGRHFYYQGQTDMPRPVVSAPIVSKQFVLSSPTDSTRLFCLNSATGDLVWDAPIEEGAVLAGAQHGKALVVGKKTRALDVATGKQLWECDPGTPVGRGVMLSQRYFLPVQGRRVVSVALDSGKITTCARASWSAGPDPKSEPPELGNLIVYEDRIISAGPGQIAAYPMGSDVLKAVQADIEEHGETAAGLLRRAKVHLCLGETRSAMEELRKTVGMEGDPAIRQQARSVLFYALLDESTGPEQALPALKEAEGLIQTPEEKLLYLERLSGYYARVGDVIPALRTSREFASLSGNRLIADSEVPGLQVRASLWLAGRLLDVWRSAPQEQKTKLVEEFSRELAQLEQTPDKLRSFLEVYGEIPDAAPTWLKLAGTLAQGDEWTEAEFIYLRLTRHEKAEIAAAALLGLAKLTERLGLPEDCAHFCCRAVDQFGSAKLEGGKTASQAAQEMLAALRLPAARPSPDACDLSKIVLTRADAQQRNRYRYQQIMVGEPLPYFDGAVVTYDNQTTVSFSRGKQKWDFDLPNVAIPGVPGKVTFQGYYGQYAHAVGHSFYYANRGTLVLASPVRQKVEWRREPKDDWMEGGPFMMPIMQVTNFNIMPDGGIKVYNRYPQYQYNRNARLVGASPRCLLLVDTNDLVALDPLREHVLWRRPLDLPMNSDVYLTDQFLYEIHQMNRLKVYRLNDGKMAREKPLSAFFKQPGFFVQGAFLGGEDKGESVLLRKVDPLTDAEIWRFSTGTRVCYYRPSIQELGIIEPPGKVSFLSLKTGERTFQAEIPGLQDLPNYVFVWTDPSRVYLVAPQGQNMPNVNTLSYLAHAMHYNYSQNYGLRGTLYCFDRVNPKFLWKKEFTDPNQNLTVFCSKSVACPIVLLSLQLQKQVKEKDRVTVQFEGFQLTALDARDGKMVFETKLDKTEHPYHVVEEEGAVAVYTSKGLLKLQYASAPKEEPPKPANPPQEQKAPPPKEEPPKPANQPQAQNAPPAQPQK